MAVLHWTPARARCEAVALRRDNKFDGQPLAAVLSEQLAELDTAHLIATSSAAREIAGSACRKSFGSGYEGFELTFFIARAFD